VPQFVAAGLVVARRWSRTRVAAAGEGRGFSPAEGKALRGLCGGLGRWDWLLRLRQAWGQGLQPARGLWRSAGARWLRKACCKRRDGNPQTPAETFRPDRPSGKKRLSWPCAPRGDARHGRFERCRRCAWRGTGAGNGPPPGWPAVRGHGPLAQPLLVGTQRWALAPADQHDQASPCWRARAQPRGRRVVIEAQLPFESHRDGGLTHRGLPRFWTEVIQPWQDRPAALAGRPLGA